jgi:hypothetical protein
VDSGVVDVTVTQNGSRVFSQQNIPVGDPMQLHFDPDRTHLQNIPAGDYVRAATGAAAARMDPTGSLLHNGGEVVASQMDEHGVPLVDIFVKPFTAALDKFADCVFFDWSPVHDYKGCNGQKC